MTVLVPEKAHAPNHVWTLDFVQDRLSKGTGIRLLTVLDEFTRESLCIRVERRLRSEDVRLTLEALFKDYGIWRSHTEIDPLLLKIAEQK